MLDVQDLYFRYHGGFELSVPSLDVKEGEFYGIIGPNGSGKTTLLRVLSKELRPARGQVLLEGRDIRHIPEREFARFSAFVSQNPLIPGLTVMETVLLGRLPYRRDWQFGDSREDIGAAETALRNVGMDAFRDRTLDSLSGGERQMVHFARALAQSPKLLFLDEPTAFLDIAHQMRVLDTAKRLNREFGITVVAVLHELNLAAEYCDRLMMVHHGKPDFAGKPAEVLTYERIERIYETLVLVKENPLTGRPFVISVSEETRKNYRRTE